jgi:nicotinate-nucleotide adenylyltransferase
MRIALYGGSFNPPHVVHQLVALYVLETAEVDELWIMPTFQHALGKSLAPFFHRLAMCELAAAALGPRARICDVERDIGGDSKTIVTIRRLQDANPGHEFSLVIGTDLVAELPSWHRGPELARTVPLIVVGRAGASSPAPGSVAMPAVSSSDVRRALAAGRSVEGLVPRTVLDYIYEHNLYKALEEPA